MRVEEVATPVCGSNEILIKVMACGICGSDVRILKHGNARVKPGAIIGHEVAGVITEVGSAVVGFAAGDRISMSADIPCGECFYCEAGFCNNCTENFAIGHQLPGGFAEYIKVDERVWKIGPFQKIPDSMSFEEAALAEPLACAVNGMEIMSPRLKDTCAIIGSGVLGSLFAQLARAYQYKRVFLIDLEPSKLEFLKQRGIGADESFVFDDTFSEKIKSATGGHGADAVIVACGDPKAQRMAVEIAGKRGWVNFFAGLPATTPEISFPSNLIHYREVTVTGSHGSTPEMHKKALELIASGKVKVQPLITHRFPLAKLHDAFAAVGSTTDRLKVMILPHE